MRPRTILTILGITLGVLFVLSLGYLAWRSITWFFVALFLATALNPAVEFFERRGLKRGPAATLVFFLALLAVSGLGFLLIPPLVRETVEFVEALPDLIRQLDHGRGPLGFVERELHIVDRLQQAIDRGGAAGLLGFTTPIVTLAKTIATTAFSMIAIAFLTFFMLLDGRRWVDAWLHFVPDTARPRWERVFSGIYRTVGGYVTGNLLISLIAGMVAGVTLFALGVPYAVPLGILVAILDLVPLFGATLAIVIVGAAALTQGPLECAVVVVVLVVYQQIENHALQPLVYSRCVQLSPLAVLVSLLVGTELAGILGALAAIPIGGSIQVVASELLRWRRESTIETPSGLYLASKPAQAERGAGPTPAPGTRPPVNRP